MLSTVAAELSFETVTLRDLHEMPAESLDALPFGVVGLSREGVTEIYNGTEARLAGLTRAAVLGKQFFMSVAQCMNNFMVAQRLEDEAELDASLPYVLTLRMRPTPVTLRLLKSTAFQRSYLLIQR